MILKQFGLQRTGTNYLKFLLESNYEVNLLTNIGGWKHGYFDVSSIIKENINCCLVSCKNPYSWLISLFHYMKTQSKNQKITSFEVFLNSRIIIRGRMYTFDGKYPIIMRASNPIQLWNNLYYHWINTKIPNISTEIVKYEDVLFDPEKYLDKLATKLSLKRKNDRFIFPENELKPGWDGKSNILSTKSFDKKNYYINQNYLKEYKKQNSLFVEQELDADLVNQIGYNYEHRTEKKINS